MSESGASMNYTIKLPAQPRCNHGLQLFDCIRCLRIVASDAFCALRELLACSDLNFDSLEPDTVRAIQAARAVIAKVQS